MPAMGVTWLGQLRIVTDHPWRRIPAAGSGATVKASTTTDPDESRIHPELEETARLLPATFAGSTMISFTGLLIN